MLAPTRSTAEPTYAARPAGAVDHRMLPSAQQPPSSTNPQDVDVIIAIDNSGSMFGRYCDSGQPIPGGGNDSDNMRIEAANIVIASLAADLYPRETSLGIITFGDPPRMVRPLTAMSSNDPNDPARSELAAAISNPECAGDTDIVEAMRIARDELNSERRTAGNVPAVIFITDGRDTMGGGEPAIERLLNAYTLEDGTPIKFFSILLGDDPSLGSFKQFWMTQAETRDNVELYTPQSSFELPDIYQEITGILDANQAPRGIEPLAPGPTVTVPMPANVAKAVITVIKPSVSTEVNLLDPGGQVAQQRASGEFRLLQNNTQTDVYIIGHPEAGNWMFQSAGDETIRVLAPNLESLYQVQLVEPADGAPLSIDENETVAVQVVNKETGEPLNETFTFIESSYRRADAPSENAIPIQMQPSGSAPGQFTAEFPQGTFEDMQSYIFAFAVEDSVGLRSEEEVYQLGAGRIPYIASFNVPNTVYVDDTPTIMLTVSNPESAAGEVMPQITQSPPNNAALRFTASTSTTFQTELNPVRQPGEYTMSVVYAGQTRLGQDFSDTRTVTIIVQQYAWVIWAWRMFWSILTLLLVYLFFTYILIPFSPLVWAFQKIGVSPEGYIRIQLAGEQMRGGQINIGSLLRQQRRLVKLTLGPKGDVRLRPEEATLDSSLLDDDPYAPLPPKKPKQGLREKLLGKRKPHMGIISRQFRGPTIIRKTSGVSIDSPFTKGTKVTDISGNTIEYSLDKLDS
jgi:Mg-chelatase subunit ChlD